MKKTKAPNTNLSPEHKRRILIGLIGVIGVCALISLGFAGLTLAYKNKIYPNTTIGSTDFGGKTNEEARATLAQLTGSIPNQGSIRIDGENKATINLKDSDLSYSVDQTVDELVSVGRTGSIMQSLTELTRSVFSSNARSATYAIDDKKWREAVSKALAGSNTPAVDAKIVLTNDTPSISPSSTGKGVKESDLSRAVQTSLGQFIYTVDMTSQTLEPNVTETQAEYALTQTQQMLAKAPLTIAASPANTTIDAAKLFSWLDYNLKPASEAPALATPTPSPSVAPATSIQFVPMARAADTTKVLVASVDTTEVKLFLESFASTVTKDPVNAEIGAKDGKVVILKDAIDGKKVKIDEGVAAVVTAIHNTQAANQTVDLPVDTVVADISGSTLESLGLKELISTATTDFKGSPENRVHNITLGAKFLNGAILGKGQEFSTITTLGKIDGAAGYLPELVIKRNATVPDFGGGLCQVSTTLFRSALNAGLPITARQNHSYRVSYYEPPVGLDATIFQDPDVDFKFKNDTPGAILIQSKIEKTKITFEFYGTKDGRSAVITDPIITDITEPPAEIRTDTDTLPKGTVKQIEKPHPGAKTSITYTVSRDGKEINKQTFRSHYVAWPAKFLVGTKE